MMKKPRTLLKLSLQIKSRRLTLVSALTLSLLSTGCEVPVDVIDTGESSTLVDENATAVIGDAARTVCDPFQNNPNYLGNQLGFKHGIVGKLAYLPADLPRYATAQDYFNYGTVVDSTLFLDQINTPTRKFDLGFPNLSGALVLNDQGNTLYEYFGVDLESEIKLGENDLEGDYQFALLSDDGAVMSVNADGMGFQELINNDGNHPTKFLNSMQPVHLTRGSSLPIRVQYYQGPRFHISLILMWRPWPAGMSAAQMKDPQFGVSGNSTYFDYNVVPSVPKTAYMNLLFRGWNVVPSVNFQLPQAIATNPCHKPLPPKPILVAESCVPGSFVAKGTPRVGIATDPAEGSTANILSGLTLLGYAATAYSDLDVIAGKPALDGVNVLFLARKAVLSPVSAEFLAAIKNYIVEGGSLIAEYDGTALLMKTNSGSTAQVQYLTQQLALFSGDGAGGGALLPLESSRVFVTDSSHALTANLPANFLNGVRAAFALTGFDTSWISNHASFTSTGFQNQVPAGTFPALASGRCGSSRVVMLPMNHLGAIKLSPVNTMIDNAIKWVTGN